MKLAQVTTSKERISYPDDPLSLYQHLTQDAPHTMLLESAEIESKDNIKSLILTDAALMIRCEGYQLTFTALTDNGQSLLSPIQTFFHSASSNLEKKVLKLT